MSNEKTNDQLLAELKHGYPVRRFSENYVGVEALDQMISAHQLKYIEFLIQAEEENKLLEENASDLSAYPVEIQLKAMEMSEAAQFDPDYFTRNKVDKDLIMPVQICGVIKAKREEAKRKTWSVDYHARLIERLRGFREIAVEQAEEDAYRKRVNTPWYKRLFV